MPRLPDWVKQYDGLPFKEQGRERSGVDCWGLVCLISSEVFEIELPRYDGQYESTADIDNVSRLFMDGIDNWRECPARPGAIMLLRMDGKPAHVGLVITPPYQTAYDPAYFIHCEYGVGSCVEQYLSKRWDRRRVGFFEYAPIRGKLAMRIKASPELDTIIDDFIQGKRDL